MRQMRQMMSGLFSVTAGGVLVASLGAVGSGCLDRKVVGQSPNLNDNFTNSVKQTSVDKLDVLFMIDNSASMGDKQNFLAAAVPDLVTRLVQPNCLKADGVTVDGISNPDGTCPNAGDTPEFPAVHNMHLGVISSSLGPRGGDLCTPSVGPDQDDDALLLNRNGTSTSPAPDLTASNFLAWFPNVSANMGVDPGATPTVTDATTLESDFADLITGVHQDGCGIESQLESWYRFLIQPDPYATIDTTTNPGHAEWSNVDAAILKQRKDFLRPDSLVAIIDLTDENDSEIDVRSLGQQGYNWLVSTFTPPRGWAVCLTNPADPTCTSCAIDSSDPNCSMGPYVNNNDWGFNANLRHVHMKAKYGLDLQFPITRYVNGLTSPKVPDRNGEYPTNSMNQMATNYVGNNDCTNPLFAATLPDGSALTADALCNLPSGSRDADLVFYAHIGGVPYQLLHFMPGDPMGSALTTDDWVKIIGTDPLHFNYTGIDPHMIESYQPRAGLPDPTSADNADPENGREWITDSNPALNGTFVDREFACTFPLTQSRDCTQAANANLCDCPTSGTWQHQYTPPVCGDGTTTPQTTQIAAKAYPTIREIELANLMGDQGILSSLCPEHVVDQSSGGMVDELYGYRPAVSSIIDRLKNALSNQCLPEALTEQSDGTVPCYILEALPTRNDNCAAHGLGTADPDSAKTFAAQIAAGESSTVLGGPNDVSLNPICLVPELTPTNHPNDFMGATCKAGTDPGWCYVTGSAAGACAQAILFTSSGTIPSAQISLQCIENGASSSTSSDAGGGGG